MPLFLLDSIYYNFFLLSKIIDLKLIRIVWFGIHYGHRNNKHERDIHRRAFICFVCVCGFWWLYLFIQRIQFAVYIDMTDLIQIHFRLSTILVLTIVWYTHKFAFKNYHLNNVTVNQVRFNMHMCVFFSFTLAIRHSSGWQWQTFWFNEIDIAGATSTSLKK